jgi:hypothetical protein
MQRPETTTVTCNVARKRRLQCRLHYHLQTSRTKAACKRATCNRHLQTLHANATCKRRIYIYERHATRGGAAPGRHTTAMLYAYRARCRLRSRRSATEGKAWLHEAWHCPCSARVERTSGCVAETSRGETGVAGQRTRHATARASRVQSAPSATEPTQRDDMEGARGTPPPLLCACGVRHRLRSRRGAPKRAAGPHGACHLPLLHAGRACRLPRSRGATEREAGLHRAGIPPPCSTRVERAAGYGADVARRKGRRGCTRHGTAPALRV